MNHRLFKFARGHEIVGYLEQVAGDHVGVCLPLHAGITFIGRSRGMCEFRAPEALSGVIEAAQILVKIDGRRCWVTDATSTNPTTLVRSQHRESYLADAVGCPREGVIELRHESFGVAMNAREWIQVWPGDLLAHCYGCWTVVLTDTGASEEHGP